MYQQVMLFKETGFITLPNKNKSNYLINNKTSKSGKYIRLSFYHVSMYHIYTRLQTAFGMRSILLALFPVPTSLLKWVR